MHGLKKKYKSSRTTFSNRKIKTFLNIILPLFIFTSLLLFFKPNVASASGVAEFLCEIGIKYYEKGDYASSLHEFKKALIVDPDNKVAKKYIELIIKEKFEPELAIPYPSTIIRPPEKRIGIIDQTLDEFEEVLKGYALPPPGEEALLPAARPPEAGIIPKRITPAPKEAIKALPPEIRKVEEKIYKILALDETIRATQPQTKLELQIDRDLIIQGKNIARFLVTNPELVEIKRIRPNEILVMAKKIGSTYIHVWDDEGRWTFLAQVSPFRPDAPTLAELYQRQIEEAGSFKLTYSNDWFSFNSGRRLDTQERQSLSFYQNFGLLGQTPYGDLDSQLQFNKLREKTKLIYYTLGLEDGLFGPFKGFDIRAFDYYLNFGNLGFSGTNLRGVRLDSEAFKDTINYTAFWGRENQGVFSPLSPGLAESKESFFEGGRLGINLPKNIYQTFSYAHGYGSARNPTYNKNSYDYTVETKLGNTKLRTNVSHDGQTLAYILNSTYTIPKLQLTSQFRDIEDDFIGVTGRPSASGQLGGLFSLRYNPSSKLGVTARLDSYRDRLFPEPEHKKLFNTDFNSAIDLNFTSDTSLRLDYINNHDIGTISPHKDESVGALLSQKFNLLKATNTFVSVRHQSNKNATSPTLDYQNKKASLGLRLGLTDNLYYFVSKEFNWLEDYTGKLSKPQLFETGINYNRQLFDSPFYINSRIYFRDEENATGTRSFLSGEDNFEAQGELRYQPSENFNAYFNLRATNNWAENPDVTKRLESEVRFGLRWLFDTHFKWNPIGNITGIVFKDVNSDGVHQPNEPLMKDIKILLGTDKYAVTDAKGKYLFKNISGRKAFLHVDTNTLPSGFVLTGPASKEIIIEQGKFIHADFGIVARSEVYGIIFNDLNDDGKFDFGEEGISKVILTLEDETKTVTNDRGQYYLRQVSPGKHTLTLDINSLPINLIPQVSIFKEIELYEGVTYIHNIPLKEVQK